MNHADGLRTATLMLNGYVSDFAYAGRTDGRVKGTEFYLQNEGPFGHFGYLCRNVQQFFQTGQAPYPPQRTLLITGVIDAMMTSRHEGHRVVETPCLNISYSSYEKMPQRPTGPRPAGACINPNTPDLLMELSSQD